MHGSLETQITRDCHFTYCWNLWTGSLNFSSLSSVAMSCLPAHTPWLQKGDRLRLLYITYICAHTMHQTFSYNSAVTRPNITWCLIVSRQFLLSISTPFFASWHLNFNISILVKIANVTCPDTINRFLLFLNFWIKRPRGKRFNDLWDPSFSFLEEFWNSFSFLWENCACFSLTFAL